MNQPELELGNKLSRWLMYEGVRVFKTNNKKDIWIDGNLVCENGEIIQ